jgi:hypothetical protein
MKDQNMSDVDIAHALHSLARNGDSANLEDDVHPILWIHGPDGFYSPFRYKADTTVRNLYNHIANRIGTLNIDVRMIVPPGSPYFCGFGDELLFDTVTLDGKRVHDVYWVFDDTPENDENVFNPNGSIPAQRSDPLLSNEPLFEDEEIYHDAVLDDDLENYTFL